MHYRLREVAAGVDLRRRALAPELNERIRRLTAAAEARAIGRGGITLVSEIYGMSRATIYRGLRDLDDLAAEGLPGQIRRPGGGRHRRIDEDPGLGAALDRLVEPVTRGDPESPLLWTAKSAVKLAAELRDAGHRVGPTTVAALLKERGYRLQANRKRLEGAQHPDRNAQFQHIADRTKAWHAAGVPVISVDAKKKELVGDFKNAGREWHPTGHPPEVQCHDFAHLGIGKAVPYGVYDVAHQAGWVAVGQDHDTAQFAVHTIERWWQEQGRLRYPDAQDLYIVADGGGSNGSRVRLWKLELQRFATATGLRVHVSHFPPGTSKWNYIEHRLFSFISMNWRGRPLTTFETVVELIGHTTTATGLTVWAEWDPGVYPTGIRVTPAQMRALNLEADSFQGQWNYTISPQSVSFIDG
jgi:transposase